MRRFLVQRNVDEATLVVLNGLPRHVGQAEAVDAILNVETVIHLRCSPEGVLARIRSNVGRDRSGRVDDDPASIQAKLATFQERTEPLLEYYRGRKVRTETIAVTADMSAEQMWGVLEGRGRR